MRSRIGWFVGSIALATVALFVLRTPVAPGPTSVGPSSPGEGEVISDRAPVHALAAHPEPTARAEVSAASPGPARVSAKMPAQRGRADLELLVVDAGRGAASNALVRVRSHTGPRPDLYALEDDRGVAQTASADADGRVRLLGLPTGPYEILAAASADEPTASVRVLLEEPSTSVRIQLLAPGFGAREVLVRVRGEQGEPVASASVELTGGAGDLRSGRSEGTLTLRSVTDEHGLARLPDPGLLGFVVLAGASDGRKGSATVWTRQDVLRRARAGGVEVKLGPPASLSGALIGVEAERLAHARVRVRLADQTQPYWSTHGREFETAVVDGHYTFESLAPGLYTLLLDDPEGARLVLPPVAGFGVAMENSVDPLEVELLPGAAVALDLTVTAGSVLEGLVLDEHRAPLAGALVRATIAPRTSNFPDGFSVHGANVWRFDSESGGDDDHPQTHRRARSDALGRYRLAGLDPRQQRVEVAYPGRRYDRREQVEVQDGATVQLEHVLEPAGAIQGVARGGGYIGVQRGGEGDARMIAILPSEGVFCFPGLEPGRWSVKQFHSDASVEPVPLIEVDVVAGRTTWVDLDRDGVLPVRISGRVVDAHGPVEGATVVTSRKRVETDAAGRFELGSAFPWTGGVGFSVESSGLETTFQFPPMQPGATLWEGELALGDLELDVRTEDADGVRVAAQLFLQLQSSDRPEITHVSAESLAIPSSGELTAPGLPAGWYWIRARFPDSAELMQQVSLPRDEALVLRAPAVGSIDVLVVHPDGKPAAGCEIYAATWTGEGSAPAEESKFYEHGDGRIAKSGLDGHARIEGVRAGEVLVRATRESMAWGGDPGGPRAIERLSLARGERAQLRLTLREP